MQNQFILNGKYDELITKIQHLRRDMWYYYIISFNGNTIKVGRTEKIYYRLKSYLCKIKIDNIAIIGPLERNWPEFLDKEKELIKVLSNSKNFNVVNGHREYFYGDFNAAIELINKFNFYFPPYNNFYKLTPLSLNESNPIII